jgi:hypothetical protein
VQAASDSLKWTTHFINLDEKIIDSDDHRYGSLTCFSCKWRLPSSMDSLGSDCLQATHCDWFPVPQPDSTTPAPSNIRIIAMSGGIDIELAEFYHLRPS